MPRCAAPLPRGEGLAVGACTFPGGSHGVLVGAPLFPVRLLSLPTSQPCPCALALAASAGQGEAATPACVAFTNDGLLVGEAARRQVRCGPQWSAHMGATLSGAGARV